MDTFDIKLIDISERRNSAYAIYRDKLPVLLHDGTVLAEMMVNEKDVKIKIMDILKGREKEEECEPKN
jgi:hypothetical protein